MKTKATGSMPRYIVAEGRHMEECKRLLESVQPKSLAQVATDFEAEKLRSATAVVLDYNSHMQCWASDKPPLVVAAEEFIERTLKGTE